MSRRVSVSRGTLAAVIAAVALAPLPATGQTVANASTPRTAWGVPDLQGIWDFRTITPLERPSELAEQEFLSDEEAAALEAQIAQERIERDSRKDFFAYNEFWLDQGTKVIDSRRTSLIVDPSDGKIPALTPEGQRQAEARSAYTREHPADSWVDRPLEERCLLGLNAGPPIVPRGYNQNIRLLQNPGYAVILSEMIHDARIVPLDGRPHLDHVDPPVGRGLAWPLGRRDACRRHDQFHRQDAFQRIHGEPASGRTLHARRRGHDPLRVHGR